jgi:hypothetical protein
LDTIPIWALFSLTVISLVAAVELGYRLARIIRRRSREEKESSVSAVSSTVLGLLAFVLGITFAIVTDRFDAKKRLVREEASAIRTAYARTEFLLEQDRREAAALLREYLDLHLAAFRDVRAGVPYDLESARVEWLRIERRLWDMAVVNARKDMNSDVAALYIEALNDLINTEASRVAIGWRARLQTTVWVTLLAITLLGMIGFGYHTSVAGSQRTWATSILVVSFSLMIALIADLDRPQAGYIRVSQWPLEEVRTWMATDLETSESR